MRIKSFTNLVIVTLTICSMPLVNIAQGYCIPTFGGASYGCSYGMSSIQITGYSSSRLNDTPACSAFTTTWYTDRTTAVAAVNLQQGGIYNDTVNVNYPYYTTVAIWIDFNNDSVFSSSELLVVGNSGCCALSINSFRDSFTIPLSAPTGIHRMRVRTGYNLGTSYSFTTPPPPCLYYATPYTYLYYGNCRDYNVNIGLAPVCTGTPSVFTTPTGSVNVCNGATVDLKGIAGIYSGLSYQWKSGSSATGPWTAISGATNLSYTTHAITSCNYYQLTATCASSGSTGVSATVSVCSTLPLYTSIPYEQDFENWSNYCGISDVPDNHWKNLYTLYDSSWRRDDQGATASWHNPGAYNPGYWCCSVAKSGSHSAVFNSVGTYYCNYGSGYNPPYQGAMDLYVDCSGISGSKGLQFYWENYAVTYTPYGFYNADSLIVSMSTTGGSSWTRLWAQDTASLWTKVRLDIPSTSATTLIRFQGKVSSYVPYGYSYGYSNIGLDSVYVANPCTGDTAMVGISPAGPISSCAPGLFSLTAAASFSGGLTYQWQMSANGGATWSNVPGATNYIFNTPPVFDTIQYRVKVGCPYGDAITSTSSSVQVNITGRPSYASLPMKESFEHWSNRCYTADVPSPHWVNQPYINGYGYLSWRRSDAASTCCTWYYSGSTAYNNPPYCYSPSYQDSSYSARLEIYYTYPVGYSYPAKSNFYAFVNCSTPPGTKELNFYMNMANDPYTPNDSFRVAYSVDSGISFTQLLGIKSTGGAWVLERFDLPTNSPKVVIRFNYTNPNYYTYDGGIGLDAFKVVPPCSSKPSAGTITYQTPCSGVNFTMSLSGTSDVSGLQYSWYSSADGVTYIATGDTTATIVANIIAATYFKVVVHCPYSGLSDTATTLATLAPFYMCYCTPTAIYGYYAYINIGNVALTRVPSGDTVINNGDPYPYCPHSGSYQMYSDYRSSYGIKHLMYLDSAYRFWLSTIISPSYSCSSWSYWSSYPVNLYIDYNHNAKFDKSELVLGSTLTFTPTSYVTTDTFRIPLTTPVGNTGMRAIANVYYSSPYDPCSWSYFYGEVEDYLIDIEYKPCSGPVSAGTAQTTDTLLCTGKSYIITDTTYEHKQSLISSFWQYSPDTVVWGMVTGSLGKDTMSFNFTGTKIYYRFVTVCSNTNDTTYSNVIKIDEAPYYACYCYSMAIGGVKYDSSDIGAFSFGSFIVSKKGTHVWNPLATSGYMNYTGMIIDLDLDVDSIYTVGVYHILKTSHADAKVTLFIDYNNNNQYDYNSGERVWTAYTTSSDWYLTTNIRIPLDSVITDVPTGMRLILNNNVGPNVPSDQACGAYTSGETMDFVVRFKRIWTSVGSINGIENMALYPNPTTGKFTIRFNATSTVKQLDIKVMNMTGQQVLESGYDNTNGQFSTELDMTGQPRGIYFVEFVADGQKMIRKLVVN